MAKLLRFLFKEDSKSDIKMDDIKYKNDLLLETIKRIDAYIISTNAKASLIIVLNSFLLSVVFVNHNKIISLYEEGIIRVFVEMTLPLVSLFCIISSVYILRAINPWLQSSSKSSKKQKLSLLFFGDIAMINQEEYGGSFRDVTLNELFLDLTSQVSVLSNGLTMKMQKTKTGTNYLIISMIIIVILFLLFFFQFIRQKI